MNEENMGSNNVGTTEYPQNSGVNKKFPKIAVIIAVMCAICCIVYIGYNEYHKMQQIDHLYTLLTSRNWERIEQSENGDSYYRLQLDFSDNDVDYNFKSFYLSEKISTYDYQILNGKTIIFTSDYGYEQEIIVTFNDEETMMTFTPALTSSENEENWFFHND